MRLTACNCRAEHYQRAQRSWWMRLVWSRRLYQCESCGQLLFIRPTDVLFRRAEETAVKDHARAPLPAG
ncbi:MAG TPA: hypothetical protein VHL79_11145 [Ramlibacter sp.]|jgi:hypothetical protein|nr:hypothetical protein [Ramlibacter sp.]